MARNNPQNREQEKQQTASKTSTAPSKTQTEQQGDQERAIETKRDDVRGSTRGGLTTPVRGGYLSTSPFSLMRRMAEEMDRIFQDFGIGGTALSARGLLPTRDSFFERGLWGPSAIEQTAWAPQVETFRRGDKFVVRADLPGLKKEDVSVEVDNDLLTISGERSDEHEEDREGYYRSERSYGQFYRAIPLPEGVNADQVDASFQDGVLEVTLPAPKTPERRTKQVQIR